MDYLPQDAGVEQAQVIDRRDAFRQPFDQVQKRFELEVVPTGAFYVFPRVDGCYGAELEGRRIATSDDLAMLLLEKAGVAMVPGTGFGAPDHVRISYAAGMEQLDTAMDRLAAFVGSLNVPART